MKWFYDATYRYYRAPWDVGPRTELVQLVDSGRLRPCRVIDLGSGTASNCVFLAQKGFDVTGVDFSAAAVELGRQRAREAGVSVNFVVDDLTNLRRVAGPFDLLVDYGTLDDLKPPQRDPYLRSILPLTKPGSLFLLYGFEYRVRWWEKLVPFFELPLAPGEVEGRFGEHFYIETIAREVNYSHFPAGFAVYLMTRK